MRAASAQSARPSVRIGCDSACGRMAGVSERLSLHRARRPNVVWVFGDQHRAHATSYGDGNVFTPNIDNLAREGMRFDSAVAGAPWCTPFRGALLTGRYPHQSGVVANGCPLSPVLPTVAHAFGDAGYHTAYVGKWHLDGTNDRAHYVPPSAAAAFTTGWATKPPTTSTEVSLRTKRPRAAAGA